MAITAEALKSAYEGYRAWNDSASIVADYLATGGSGKGNTPYALGNTQTPTAPAGATAGTTGEVGLDFNSLMKQITTAPTGYPEAIKAEEARLPLIQQRYKSLLDEIDLAQKEGTTETRAAETSQIGETQARAAAQGIFPGTTELGSEELTRQAALKTILGLGEKGVVAKAKALADQAAEEGDVSAQVAKLRIGQAETETERYKTALDYLFKKQEADRAGSGGKSAVDLATARSGLARDVASGTDLTTLLQKYTPSFGIDNFKEIVDTYDAKSPLVKEWGTHTESWEQLRSIANQYALPAEGGLEIDQIDRAAFSSVADNAGYKDGSMTDEEIRISLLSSGANPDANFFKPLYTNNPSIKKTEEKSSINLPYEFKPWVAPTLQKAGSTYVSMVDWLVEHTNPFIQKKK